MVTRVRTRALERLLVLVLRCCHTTKGKSHLTLAAERASAARLKEEARANPTAFSLPPSFTNLVGPYYLILAEAFYFLRPPIDTRAPRADLA